MHEVIRNHAIASWEKIQNGEHNMLADNLAQDSYISHYLSNDEIEKSLLVSNHLGTAVQRAKKLVQKINKIIKA
jgi:adenylosuccinate lyase